MAAGGVCRGGGYPGVFVGVLSFVRVVERLCVVNMRRWERVVCVMTHSSSLSMWLVPDLLSHLRACLSWCVLAHPPSLPSPTHTHTPTHNKHTPNSWPPTTPPSSTWTCVCSSCPGTRRQSTAASNSVLQAKQRATAGPSSTTCCLLALLHQHQHSQDHLRFPRRLLLLQGEQEQEGVWRRLGALRCRGQREERVEVEQGQEGRRRHTLWHTLDACWSSWQGVCMNVIVWLVL